MTAIPIGDCWMISLSSQDSLCWAPLARLSGTCACGHRSEAGHHHPSHSGDAESDAKHNRMVDPIADCQVLIAGGMGYGAYQALKSRNLQVFITAESSIQKAVELLTDGKLDNLMERLH